MRIPDYVIESARAAGHEAYRYALAVPAEKLTWTPEGARSVLGMCQELAVSPTWAHDTISDDDLAYTEETMKSQRAEMQSWDSV